MGTCLCTQFSASVHNSRTPRQMADHRIRWDRWSKAISRQERNDKLFHKNSPYHLGSQMVFFHSTHYLEAHSLWRESPSTLRSCTTRYTGTQRARKCRIYLTCPIRQDPNGIFRIVRSCMSLVPGRLCCVCPDLPILRDQPGVLGELPRGGTSLMRITKKEIKRVPIPEGPEAHHERMKRDGRQG